MVCRPGTGQAVISVSGRGIHSGEPSTVTFHRTEGPVQFLRNGQRIPASHHAISDTGRQTVLSAGSEQVAMVEHLLAALAITGFWTGLLLEVSGAEIPVLDGSAREWLPALEQLGPPPPEPDPLVPAAPLHIRAGSSSATLEPGSRSLHVTIDFAAFGRQEWAGGPEDWHHLLDARTFGFQEELGSLHARGLALGASLDNTLVFHGGRAVNAPRGSDEPVRHKALDAVGDLFLLGRPLQARLSLTRPSHGLHARLLSSVTEPLPREARA